MGEFVPVRYMFLKLMFIILKIFLSNGTKDASKGNLIIVACNPEAVNKGACYVDQKHQG